MRMVVVMTLVMMVVMVVMMVVMMMLMMFLMMIAITITNKMGILLQYYDVRIKCMMMVETTSTIL